MHTQLIAAALMLSTTAAVALYPVYRSAGADAPPVAAAQAQQVPRPRIEAVFVLDTTASMAGLIQAAKEKIWSIATSMASAQPAPDIAMGLVAFRDRGDAYVTRVVDLTTDIDAVYAELMALAAAGGGDGPESVNLALYEALHGMSWSTQSEAYRVIFLVGDSPPHMDYANEVQYPQSLAQARQRGIFVNAIQAGDQPSTATHWSRIAQLGGGSHFAVGQDGDGVALNTPFDEELATLSKELDDSRLYFGSVTERAEQERKLAATLEAHRHASTASLARRATFNATPSGKTNLLGEGELVEELSAGRVDLDDIPAAELPEALRELTPRERETEIGARQEQRRELVRRIDELQAARTRHLERAVREQGGAAGTLDDRVYQSIRQQGASLGLKFEAAAPAY